MKKTLLSILLAVMALSAMAESRADRLLRELRNPKSNYVFVAAHRGDWRDFPENTVEAVESAIRMGCDIVEIDVHRTADGHLICMHDATINRTTNGKGAIKELTLDSIRNCKIRTGHNRRTFRYKVPTLEEMLDACRGRILINIDKGWNYYAQILGMLKERGMVEHVIIKSSKKPTTVEKHMSAHRENMLYMPIINYTQKAWERHEPLFNSYLSCSLPLVAYEVCWDGSMKGEQKVFKSVLKSGVRLWVNTLWDSLCGGDEHGLEDDRAVWGNEEAIYGKVLATGASMIQSDRPQQLIHYLESKGRHTLK